MSVSIFIMLVFKSLFQGNMFQVSFMINQIFYSLFFHLKLFIEHNCCLHEENIKERDWQTSIDQLFSILYAVGLPVK